MLNREDDAQCALQRLRELAMETLGPEMYGPAKGKVFIDAAIEGRRFQGMSDGHTWHLVGPNCGRILGPTSNNHRAPWD